MTHSEQMDDATLVALLSAAASVALGGNVRLVSYQQADEYSKFVGWVQFARTQQFLVSRTR